MKKREGGFTLIEFLIALVIIGFIVGLLVNFFGNPLKQASVAKVATQAIQDTTALVNGTNMYYAKKGKYPPMLDALQTEGITTIDISSNSYAYLDGPLDGAGFYSTPVDVALGDGTTQKMIVLSIPFWDPATPVCQKINEMTMGSAPDAAVPDTTGGTFDNWAARPPATVGKGSFCVKVGGNYDFYMAL